MEQNTTGAIDPALLEQARTTVGNLGGVRIVANSRAVVVTINRAAARSDQTSS